MLGFAKVSVNHDLYPLQKFLLSRWSEKSIFQAGTCVQNFVQNTAAMYVSCKTVTLFSGTSKMDFRHNHSRLSPTHVLHVNAKS